MRFLLLMAGWFLATDLLATPPNIVLIIADDQTYTDFGFMGNECVHTPHLDQLASTSIRFTNGYVPTSVCRPSLVTLLTGLYPHEHGVYFNHGPPGNSKYNQMTSSAQYREVREREFELIAKVPTLPGLLAKKAGYRSFQTGKFWEGHWQNGGFTSGMTTFTAPPKSQTFGGVRKLANGERVAHGNGDHGLIIGRETMQPIYDFVKQSEADKVPWLVWYAPYLPHQPHDSPEKFYQMARSKPKVNEHEIPYFASIAQFDDTVGELVRYVNENASDPENTIYVLVSDNGWAPSKRRVKKRPVEFEHTKNSKRAPFDEGLRTPILVSWPKGGAQPRTVEAPVSSIDIVPTLLLAAGIEVDVLPGVDLLKTDSMDPQRPIFGEIYPGDGSAFGGQSQDIAYRWVRRGDLKLIVTHGEKPWGDYLKSDALFNVTEDPTETRNLINEADLSSEIIALRKLLDQWWKPEKS